MMSRRTVVLAALVLVLGSCGGGSDDPAGDDGADAGDGRTVILKDIAFKPGSISVSTGDTVTWRFEDGGIPHNVVAEDESFQSETTDSGTFTHTFETAGKFRYVCTLHPIMKGTVEVT